MFGTPAAVRQQCRRGPASFNVHPHLLRHACGFKLANEGHDTPGRYSTTRAQKHPAHGALQQPRLLRLIISEGTPVDARRRRDAGATPYAVWQASPAA
jgi:hypothetical protein